MPGGARYVDLSTQALKLHVEPILMAAVQQAALVIRDEIVAVINESTPSGREYPIPGTTAPRVEDGEKIPGKWYTASAPGEPPAERTATYRSAWANTRALRDGSRIVAGVYNPTRVGSNDEHLLWTILEYGTSDQVNFTVRMQPRPHVRVAVDRAMPKIRKVFQRLSA